ncbi:hypothetical protein, partial [Actinocorallia aurantiaca]|uniref:hypothetical protein n=1 Tax=Actinocorallia aurantiaca TaxID=46204 RepID=UPI0031DDD853
MDVTFTHFRPGADTNHFLSARCTECTAGRLSRMNLGEVETAHYLNHLITSDALAAYRHVWASLSPHGGGNASWHDAPSNPAVAELAGYMRTAY